MTQNYKISFLQKTLGKNYKWWYIFLYGIRQNMTYVISDMFWFLGRLLYIFAIIYVYANSSDTETLKNVIFNNLFASFLAFFIAFDLDEDISKGSISALLVTPSNIFSIYLFRRIGVGIKGITFNVLVFISIIYLFGFKIELLSFFIVILFSLFFTILIKFYLDFIVGSLTFWVKNGYGVINFYLTLFAILNGSLIPLDRLPKLFLLNPMAFVAHYPMQIYLGKYNPREILLVFGGGIFWCILLYFLAKIVFQAGLKKNESVGL